MIAGVVGCGDHVPVIVAGIHQRDHAGLAGHPLLLLAAYRPAEAGSELEHALEVLARRSLARLALAGLPVPDAAELITSVAGAGSVILRGLEDIRWAANDRGVAALPGRPDQS